MLAALFLPLCAPPSPQDEFAARWNGYALSAVGWPEAATTADFDGDGDVDLAASHYPATRVVAVVKNDGFGGYGAPAYFEHRPEQKGGRAILAADFDGDGAPDLAVANTDGASLFAGQTVALLHGLGDGAFAPYELFDVAVPLAPIPGPHGLAAADLDLDGNLDLAVACYGAASGGGALALLRNDGAQGFLPPFQLASGTAPQEVAAGDLDRNGFADLVVVRENEGLAVHKADAHGFAPPVEHLIYCGQAPASGLALGDVDRDGLLDVVWGTGELCYQRNDGEGGLFPATHVELDGVASPQSIEIGDVTGDGWPDVIAAGGTDNRWVLVQNDGSGDLLAPIHLAAGEWPSDVELVDVDQDSDLDPLVIGHFSKDVAVHRNPGDGAFAPEITPLGGYLTVFHEYADAADADLDGDLDAIVAYKSFFLFGEPGVAVLYNIGGGVFNPIFFTAPDPIVARLRDVTGDGLADALAGSEANGFVVRHAIGGGTFGPAIGWTTLECNEVRTLDGADLDGDGDQDVLLLAQACASGGTTAYHAFENDGTGSFALPVQSPTGLMLDFALGDFDLDGALDVAGTGVLGSEALRGLGDGTFAPYAALPTAGARIVAPDVDADGRADLAILAVHTAVHRAHASGFGPAQALPAAAFFHDPPRQIAAGDGDGDGDVDLFVLNAGPHSISMYPNDGSGAFGPDLVFGAGPLALDLVAGDFTGDGALDLAPIVSYDFLIDGLALVRGQKGGLPWTDLGGGLPGVAGVPKLSAGGVLKAGGKVSFALAGARPDSLAAFAIGLSTIDLPLFGGTFVPSPDALVVLPTAGDGSAQLAVKVPPLPPAQAAFAQAWVIDPAAPQGVSGSNAVTSP